jgi:hypothetical protein
MVNVICMKWGKKYGPEYVNVLARMVARNLAQPHRFVCFTDDKAGIDAGIECLPLPVCKTPNRPEIQAWRKISLFTSELGLTGPTLFLDLDVAVTGPLDPFFSHAPGRFCIIHNWTHPDRRVGNSSVFRFEAGQHTYVFDEYNCDPDKVADENRNEQIYVTDRIDAKEGALWWPDEWCKSFKKHCLPKGILKLFIPAKLPQGCRVVVFHGDPNPPEASKNWVFKGHHLMRPARWVANYWR